MAQRLTSIIFYHLSSISLAVGLNLGNGNMCGALSIDRYIKALFACMK